MAAWETHAGLLQQAIPYYNRKSFVNISNQNQTYTFFPAMMGRANYAEHNRLRWGLPNMVDGNGGTTFVFNVQVSAGSTFDWVDETTPINVARKDHQVQATLPWRMCRSHWSINMRELEACRGAEQITDLMTSRRVGDDQDWADSFEAWGWGAPPASTDVLTAFPLRYWLFTAAETTAGTYTAADTAAGGSDFVGNGDFLGGGATLNHASYTSGPAGISRITYKYWGNYNFQHTAFNDDLIDKIGHAVLKTSFHAPVDYPDKVQGPPDRAMYANASYVLARAKLARQQNDQNTSDLQARFSENAIFRIPMYYVPQLDSITGVTAPIYGVNWATWYLATKDQYSMKDELFPPDRSAPMDTTHARILECQLVCCEPRQNWVTSTDS